MTPNLNDPGSLERRLVKLESQNRASRRLGSIFFAFAGAVLFMGQGQGQATTMKVEALALVDSDGKTWAELGLKDGKPGLRFFDKNGKERAELGEGKNDGAWGLSLKDDKEVSRAQLDLRGKVVSVTLSDDAGVQRGGIGVDAKGDPQFVFCDKAGTARTAIGLTAGTPRVILADEAGKIRAGLGLKADGAPFFTLQDEQELASVSLRIDPKSISGLAINDGNGKARMSLALEDGGAAVGLRIGDAKERLRVVLGLTPRGETLLAFDSPEGKRQAELHARDDGQAQLGLCDSTGAPRCGLTVDKEGAGLRLLDSEHRERVALYHSMDTSELVIEDDNKKRRASVTVHKGDPSVHLVGADEEPRVSLFVTAKESGVKLKSSDKKTRGSFVVSEDGKPSLRLQDQDENPLFKAP